MLAYAEQGRAGIRPRMAVIPEIGAEQDPPATDGRLDDLVWRDTPALAPFTVRLAEMVEISRAPTRAKVTRDEERIYVAVTCHEPKIDQIHSSGNGSRDSDAWRADCVEGFLLPSEEERPYYQFIVNPENTRFDAFRRAGDDPLDVSSDADWESAEQVLDGRWTLEFAIPWKAVGGAPQTGERRRANIGRTCGPDPREISSWSLMWEIYADMQYAGTFIFGDE